MDDPTRLSCCERDARDSERNMKILTELRKRDPTRIALQKRNLRYGSLYLSIHTHSMSCLYCFLFIEAASPIIMV